MSEVRARPKGAGRGSNEIGCNGLAQRWPRLREVSMNGGKWTDEENERLKAFVAKGVSIFRVAAIFNRTVAGVRVHAQKIGTPFPPVRELRKKWADAAFRA
jgi:hypothetical protein